MASDGINKEFAKYRRQLQQYGDSLGIIIAETINSIAIEAHEDSRRNMQSRMTLRNKYMERSLKFYKANPKSDWTKINAISGSVNPLMESHDMGETLRPKRGKAYPMPTLHARGGSANRVKRRARWLGQDLTSGDLKKRFFVGKPRGGGKNAAKKNGIYERTNGNRKIRMTHNLEDQTVKLKPNAWHRDAISRKYTRNRVYQEFTARAKAKLAYLGK